MTRRSEDRTALHASPRALALGLGALAALALLGCPNPNSYGTPRTIAPGKLQHTVALEAFHIRGKASGNTESYTLPSAPTYQLRLGVLDRVDVGFRVPNLSSVGADLKWNFLRGDIDAAFMPGVQGVLLRGLGGLVYLHGGVPIGFNISESTTFVLTPGLSYAFLAVNGVPTGRDALLAATGALLRLSAGFAFRIGRAGKSPKFTVFPEVTAMRALGSTEALVLIPGIGFQFGAAPEYSDQSDPEDRPAPPPPPRPGHTAPPVSAPPSPKPGHTAPPSKPTPAPAPAAPAPSPNPLPPPPPPGPR